jgi:ubiquinone/menaquinone biosynthesis C-methylase UbiE
MIEPETGSVAGDDGSAAAPEPRLAVIADAFSRTARRYDEFAEDHPHLTRMRAKVYAHLEGVVAPGSSVLELNAGTGTDAVELARRGFRVHATDIAPGMLERLRDKVARLGLEDRLTVQSCSFLDLDRVTGGPYDAVFSDLGGLNCTSDLRPVIAGLDRVLRPGGSVVWVLMPRICLWELGLALTGQFRLAFRRLSRNGTRAHLEGRSFDVHYFDPRRVIADFGPGYELLGLEGLSVITPTAESKNLAKRHRRIYGALCWLDDRLARRAPFSGWGDFFILSLRRRADSPGNPVR